MLRELAKPIFFACFLGLITASLGCKPKPALEGYYFSSSESLRQLPASAQLKINEVLDTYFGTPTHPTAPLEAGLKNELLKSGARFYQINCLHCHGISGGGSGPTAKFLSPKPRDFRKGIFKFTSTSSSAKPSRDDLMLNLKNGVNYTSMPSFAIYKEEDLHAVVEYVMLLSMRGQLEELLIASYEFDREEINDEHAIIENADLVFQEWANAQKKTSIVKAQTPRPAYSQESIERGRKLFLYGDAQCIVCHAFDGSGNVQAALAPDSWGNLQKAADLTQGIYRGGGRPIDLYRRIYSGVKGSAMPGFGEQLSSEQIWDLVNFVLSLAEAKG